MNDSRMTQMPGTHFWHSHTSFQRGDGAFGSYVVRQPHDVDHHGDLYDEDRTEHIIFVQEFFHIVSCPCLCSPQYIKSISLLVNKGGIRIAPLGHRQEQGRQPADQWQRQVQDVW